MVQECPFEVAENFEADFRYPRVIQFSCSSPSPLYEADRPVSEKLTRCVAGDVC